MDKLPDTIENKSENEIDKKQFKLKKITIDASVSHIKGDNYQYYNSLVQHILTTQFPQNFTKTNTISTLINLQNANYAHYILVDVENNYPYKTIYGFCTIQWDETNKHLYRSDKPDDNGIGHIYLWNVAKQPGLMSHPGICSMMLKMIKTHYNNDKTNTPIFLNVDPTNRAAVKCYSKQGFTFVKRVIDSKLRDVLTNQPFIKYSENELIMLYNRDYLFYKVQNPPQETHQKPPQETPQTKPEETPQDTPHTTPQETHSYTYSLLLPTTSQRFVFIAHGVLDTAKYSCELPSQNITVSDVQQICSSGQEGYQQIVDMIPTETKNNENNENNESRHVALISQIKEYYFPFKHITFYSAPGDNLSADVGLFPKQNLARMTCFANNMIHNTTEVKPTMTKDNFNKDTRIALHNMYFRGDKYDPPEKKELIGLYHCNMGTHLITYRNMCPENSNENKSFGYDDVIKYICRYCDENVIPYENVELSIYACRGFTVNSTDTTFENDLHDLLSGEDQPQQTGGDENIPTGNPSIEKPVTYEMFQERVVKFANSNMCERTGGKRRKRHTYINPKHVKQATRKIKIQMKHKRRSTRVKRDIHKKHKTQKKRSSKTRHTKQSRRKNRRNVERIRIKMN